MLLQQHHNNDSAPIAATACSATLHVKHTQSILSFLMRPLLRLLLLIIFEEYEHDADYEEGDDHPVHDDIDDDDGVADHAA